jgi:hypothetical protein
MLVTLKSGAATMSSQVWKTARPGVPPGENGISNCQSWVGHPPVPLSTEKKAESAVDRYELHDLHDGSTPTSAIIDKKTGQVWVWTSATRGGYFASKEILPEPEQ